MTRLKTLTLLFALIVAENSFAMFPVCQTPFGPIIPRTGSQVKAQHLTENASTKFQGKAARFLGSDGKRETGSVSALSLSGDPYEKDPMFIVVVKFEDGTRELTLRLSELEKVTGS